MRFRKNDTITLNENEQIVIEDFLGDVGHGKIGYMMDLRPKNYVFFVAKSHKV